MQRMFRALNVRRAVAGVLAASFAVCCPFLSAAPVSDGSRVPCHGAVDASPGPLPGDEPHQSDASCVLDRIGLPESGERGLVPLSVALDGMVALIVSSSDRGHVDPWRHRPVPGGPAAIPLYVRTSAFLF